MTLTACSKSETADAPPAPAVPPAASTPANTGLALTPAAPPPPASAPAPQNLTATPPVTETGLMNGEVYSKGDDGNVLQGEALLKKALMQHVEGKGLPYPARIEELVEKGTLKALPPAPAGKKWALDPTTKQVVLN